MSEGHIGVQWAVFRSGRGPYDDYKVTAMVADGSADTKERLSESIRFLCHGFYSDIEMPSEENKVFFFWQIRKDLWALSRITDDKELAGQRRGVEYLHLLLPAEQLLNMGGPLTLMGADAVWDAIRTKGQLQDLTLLNLQPPPPPASTASAAIPEPLAPELPFTPANEAALKRWLQQLLVANQFATFATWWPSTRPTPRGVFSVVLRAPSLLLPGRGEIKQLADRLAAELIGALPSPHPDDVLALELTQLLTQDASELADQVGETMRLGETLEPDVWRQRTSEGAGTAARIARNLKALGIRSTVANEAVESMARMGREYARLEFGLEKQPAPFRPQFLPELEELAADDPLTTSAINRPLVLALCAIMLFVAGWGLGYLTAPQQARSSANSGVSSSN
nr:hypothetical protein [Armatimonas sp.]